MFMTPCPFLAEKIWIINESVSCFNILVLHLKASGLLRRYAPRNDGKRGASRLYLLPGSEITRLATSLFQMNSTTSAPIVAVMKPAP